MFQPDFLPANCSHGVGAEATVEEVTSQPTAKWETVNSYCLGLPWWLSGKETACNAGVSGDAGLIPGSGRCLGGGHGNPLQYSCLENPVDSMKRQNDRILKEELPRSVGTQYATGDQWRNNSRKNEGMEPKQR